MTDRLQAALAEAFGKTRWAGVRVTLAKELAATTQMQAIARQAAIGAAVERWVADNEYPCGECLNLAYQGHEGGCRVGRVFGGIHAAIEEALHHE